MRNADVLELTARGAGHTRTVFIRRGSLEVSLGHLSYVVADDEQKARNYLALHCLESWRLIDRSHVDR